MQLRVTIAIWKDMLLEIVTIKISDFETPVKESILSKVETEQLVTLLKLNSGLVVSLKFFEIFLNKQLVLNMSYS